MNRSAPIVMIMVVAVLGFFSGASLEAVMEGSDSKIFKVSNFIAGIGTNYEFIPVIKTAEMSGALQTIIEEANIGFNVIPILVDPTLESPGSGDEYFNNEVNICRFHSDEDIHGSVFLDESFDDGICIVCKILHHEDPCEDIWLDFTNLPDKTTETDINNNLAANGITVSAQAFDTDDPNTVVIFDSDISHGTGDEDIEGTGTGGDCAACNGQHLVIIPEGTGNPPVAKIPLDDSAQGGIQTWKFNPARFVTSFDFFDKDNGQSAEARAYLNSDCTGLITTVPIPNGNANDVDTIIMNANNVRCLEIEYPDSGGVSNFDLRCVEHLNVLGKGQIDLPLGYDASDTIEIPIPEGVNVLDVSGVKLLIESVILDFEGLPAGTILNTQYLADFGITIDGEDHNGDHLDPQVFDTDASGTPDPDLEVDVGNVAIVPEDLNNNGIGDVPADDSAHGGKQIFHFDPPRYVNSLIFVDADRGGTIGYVTAFDEFDDVIGSPVPIPTAGDESIQVLVMMNTEKTTRLEIEYEDSGAIKGLNLGCPLPTDPLHMGPMNDPPEDELYVELILNDVWDPSPDKDDPLIAHLTGLPEVASFSLVSDDAVDAPGQWNPDPNTNVIVISESVDSGKLNDLKNVGVGIVTVEGYTWDELDLGTSGNGVNGAGTQVKILDNSHYITQALGVNNGDIITIADVAGNSGRILGWDTGASQINGLAVYTSPNDDSEARLLAVDSGETLADGSSAADRRVFLGARYFDNLNSIGEDLFDRALIWASGLAS